MKKINHYYVHIVLETGLCRSEIGSKFGCVPVEILAENELRICLNDLSFTTIEKKNTNYHWSIDKPSIYHHAKDSVFGTEIKYNLHTFKNKRKATIAKEIKKYIDDKFGVFANIDLSFLDD